MCDSVACVLLQLVPFQASAGTSSQGAPAGGSAINPDLWLDVYSQNALTRTAGRGPSTSQTKVVPRRVVVDVREFMSALPAVLHQQGFLLTPVTLEVMPTCNIKQAHSCFVCVLTSPSVCCSAFPAVVRGAYYKPYTPYLTAYAK